MNVHFRLAKIVQGECNGKGKAKDFHFALPSRSLSYPKIVQGECKEGVPVLRHSNVNFQRIVAVGGCFCNSAIFEYLCTNFRTRQ